MAFETPVPDAPNPKPEAPKERPKPEARKTNSRASIPFVLLKSTQNRFNLPRQTTVVQNTGKVMRTRKTHWFWPIILPATTQKL
jgi:hypothetical protein